MSKIYCSNCGKLIPENSNFCRFCGAAQHGTEAAVYQAEAPVIPHTSAPTQNVQRPRRQIREDEYFRHQHLAPLVVLLFFFNYIGKSAAMLPLLIIGFFFEPVWFGVITASYLLMTYLIAALVYNSFRFTVDENGYNEEYGILHKKHVSLTYQQIQNVNINRSVIDRLLGLARISIETAGHAAIVERESVGGGKTKAEAHLPGVTLKNAKKIHDLLLLKTVEENGG